MNKVCGPRATKDSIIYSKEELVQRAMNDDHNTLSLAQLRRMTKKTLCNRLGISFYASVRDAPNSTAAKMSKSQLIARLVEKYPAVLALNNPTAMAKLKSLSVGELRHLLSHEGDFESMFPNAATAPAPPAVKCMARSKIPLRDHQKTVVDFLEHHRSLLAVHALGSGKTLMAITATQCFLDRSAAGRVLILCPASVTGHFEQELNRAFDDTYKDRYLILSYQTFYGLEQPLDCADMMLILDEAHNFRTPYAKTKSGKQTGKVTRSIEECAVRAEKLLLLTATPLFNNVMDLYSLARMVRDRNTPPIPIKVFRDVLGRTVMDHTRVKNLLQNAFRCKISFWKNPTASSKYALPKAQDVFLEMTPDFLKLYNEVEANNVTENVLAIFREPQNFEPFYNGIRRAVNIMNVLEPDQLLKTPKVKFILEALERAPSMKTIIFSHFLELGLDIVLKHLPAALRAKAASITGRTTPSNRKKIIRDFNDNKISMLFVSKAGGEGINLKGVRRIFIMEPSWNENALRQLVGRGIRYESHEHLPLFERKVKIYHLFHIKPDEKPESSRFSLRTIVRRLQRKNAQEAEEEGRRRRIPSADILLKILSQQKEERMQKVLQIMQDLSIEQNSDKCMKNPSLAKKKVTIDQSKNVIEAI